MPSPPAGCEVYEDVGGEKGEKGKVVTRLLEAETTDKTKLLFKLAEGKTVFASFHLKGWSGSAAPLALNKKYEVSGELTAEVSGAEHRETRRGDS